MRPVSKPPATAAYVIANYTPVTNFKYIVGNAKLLAVAKWGTNKPTTAQAVAELQRINRKAKATRTAKEKAFKKATGTKVGAEYKKAAPILMYYLGSYCSYCENIIAQLVEVEHVLPKSTMATEALNWDNFLLSCGPCNNAKSNNPSFTTMQTLLALPALPTSAEYTNGLQQYYVWPDKDTQSYEWMRYALCSVAGTTFTTLPDDQQASLEHKKVKYFPVTRNVRANIYDPTAGVYLLSTNVRVRLSGTGGPTAHVGSAKAVDRSIALLQLNEQRGDSEAYDSRASRRTQAWFEALDAIKRIQCFKPGFTGAQDMYDAMWAQAMSTAKKSGFFSTWLSAFDKYPYKTYFGETFNSKFLSLTNNTNFLNTDKTNLPTV